MTDAAPRRQDGPVISDAPAATPTPAEGPPEQSPPEQTPAAEGPPGQSPPAEHVHTRAALERVPAYKPGRPPTARPGITPYKMSSNENPYPPLPGVLDAALAAAGRMNRYPDMFATALVEKIAQYVGVTPQEIVVGTGSSGVLTQIVAATSEAGDEVMYAWRSFEAYPIMVACSGARAVPVPLDAGHRHDLTAMADAITPATSLILLCTPNNPTGTAIHADELEEFLRAVPPQVVVVLDEAYGEFNDDPDAPALLEVYRRHPNVIVLRTFSKAFGLAGLRIGYAVARPELAEQLRKTAVPFGVSLIAQECAIASLEAVPALIERVEHLRSERDRVHRALVSQGWDIPRSQANFVWLPLRARSLEFAALADEVGLSVRPFDGEGVRVSVDAPEANDRFIAAAATALPPTIADPIRAAQG